ncbi:MAG: FAD-dependent oxidoreductase [Candidatus Anstonellaceae archaeon]
MIEYKDYKLKKKEKETELIYTLEFEPLDFQVPLYSPGQFFMIKINNLETKPNFRPYSALLPYQKNKLAFGIKKHGIFSSALVDLQIGQNVQIAGPYGQFLFDENVKYSIFLAGGIGITPFVCMLKNLENKIDEQKKAYLFYSNKTKEDIAYKNLLDEIAANNPSIKIIYTLTQIFEDKFEKGRINIEMIQKYSPQWKEAKYYLCGTKEFVLQLSKMLIENNINPNNIKTEKW